MGRSANTNEAQEGNCNMSSSESDDNVEVEASHLERPDMASIEYGVPMDDMGSCDSSHDRQATQSQQDQEKKTEKDDSSNSSCYYKQTKEDDGNKGGFFQSMMPVLGAVGAALFGVVGVSSIFDEDDVVAAATIAHGATATTADAAVKAAYVQQMAVGAAQGAANSVATGTAAGSAAAAGGAGGGGAASAATNTGQAGVAVTTVAGAALAANAMLGGDVQGLCPNVPNYSILPARLTVDFVTGDNSLLTELQARDLATSMAEEYNDIMGCDSDYSRLILNCSIPCQFVDIAGTADESLGANATNYTSLCCDRYRDDIFGDVLQCQFDCYVHCDGCSENEPLFLLVNQTEGIVTVDEDSTFTADFFPTPVPAINIESGTLSPRSVPLTKSLENMNVFPTLDQSEVADTLFPIEESSGNEDEDVSTEVRDTNRILSLSSNCTNVQCEITRTVEMTICDDFLNNAESCAAVRSVAYNPEAVEADEQAFTLVPLPTSVPTKSPTISPSESPSTKPSIAPSIAASKGPTLTPSNVPSPIPSAEPSPYPTRTPTPDPTHGPSEAPTPNPTHGPMATPTAVPTREPTFNPTPVPTKTPTAEPTRTPSTNPTESPSKQPMAFFDLG